MNALRRIAIAGCALALTGAPLACALAQATTPSKPSAITFGGTEYPHRWSKGTQHQYTPRGDEDLSRWRDRVTNNVHDAVASGDQLAGVARQVLGNYRSNGKILRTDSRPRTAERPAEHSVAALFGDPSMVEAAFVVVADLGVQGSASAPSAPKLQQFVYVLRVAPAFQDQGKWTDKENDAVGRHFARLAEATKAGRVIFAGRTNEALDKTFGLVVFEAEDASAAKQFMESDPAVVAGVMTATLHPYVLALQRRP